MSVCPALPSIREQRKRVDLPYKWPLLADGQDPSALEARLAFHLHRLNLTGEPLREALNGKAKLATALTQARADISPGFISELATTLNIAADELQRDLTEQETREWGFYRTSATHSETVWQNAVATARRHSLSLRAMAETIGMKQSDLQFAITGQRPRIFELHHARLLLEKTSPSGTPEQLLPMQRKGQESAR